MPKYFFDFYGGDTQLDDEGTELRNVSTAQREAQQALAELLKDESATCDDVDVKAKVRHEDGTSVVEVVASMHTRRDAAA